MCPVRSVNLCLGSLTGLLHHRRCPHRSKNVVQVRQILVNFEWKANKKKKNGLLGFVTTCRFLAVCVGSGKI